MTIEQWWGHSGFERMEETTGLRHSDYSPENYYQDFTNACIEWWEKRTNDEKIKIWVDII